MILYLLVQEQWVFNSLYFKIDQTLFGFTLEKATNIQFSGNGANGYIYRHSSWLKPKETCLKLSKFNSILLKMYHCMLHGEQYIK